MSTFDITDNPAQVYLGDQSVVSLVNDGPFTVYFDETTSVDSINGFELPPTGQMTWKGNKPLFARTAVINIPATPAGFQAKARLRTTISGELSLTTRAKFYKPLFVAPPFNQAGSARTFVESGHCQTLEIVITASIAELTGAGPMSFQTTWYDETFTVITSETWTAQFGLPGVDGITPPNTSNVPTWRALVPVKGKYCLVLPAFIPTATTTLRIVGTDSELPNINTAGVSWGGGAVPVNPSYNGKFFTFQWNTNVGGQIRFPMHSELVRIGISNPFAAVQVIVSDVTTGAGVRAARLDLPAGNDVYYEFNLPINTNYVLHGVTALAGNATFQILWPNDRVSG